MRPDTNPFLTIFPFRTALPLPTQDPDAGPTIDITIACSWLPYIRGALAVLTEQFVWPQDDPAAMYLAQQRAMSLIAMFVECTTLPPFACNYDFTVSDGGWHQRDEGSSVHPSLLSEYTAGQGWTRTEYTYDPVPGRNYAEAECEINFASTHITSVLMTYDLEKGTFTTGEADTGIIFFSGGSVVGVVVIESSTDPDGTGKSIPWTGDIVCDTIVLRVLCSLYDGGIGLAGIATITNCYVSGEGGTIC